MAQARPQVSGMVQFVVHAIVALDALSKARAVVQCPLGTRALPISSHYQEALTRYGKTLSGMRASLTGRREDMRKALIGCLLTFYFEALQSNEYIASQHASQIIYLASL